MKALLNKSLWVLLILLAFAIGLYPLAYVFGDMSGSLLSRKSAALLNNQLWNFGFYTHILLGGLALLIGWVQFSKKLRNKYLTWHRRVGYIYTFSVLLSGITGGFIALNATGGTIAQTGFFCLAILWLLTTSMAIISIKKKEIERHQNWMRRSYALTFAAVTLRLWMPILIAGFGMKFIEAYVIIAWLSWVPNIILTELFIRFYFR